MGVFYKFAELFATFLEGMIALSVATKLSENRYDKKKNLFLLLTFATVYTVIITLMNNWKVFSFITLAIGIFYTFLITKITAKGTLLIRSTAVMLSWFFVNAIDYLIFYISIMIVGKSLDISKGIDILLSPGATRSAFIILVKLIELLILLSLNRFYSEFHLLNKKHLSVLLIISTCSYVMMSIITSLIFSDSILTLQISVIFSLLFIILSLISTILATALSSRYQAEKQERYFMEITNKLMEKNFQTMQNSQHLIRQQVHDFKNHIRTINGMLELDMQAKKYTNDLLSVSYAQAQYCHCGNEIINSIINCKIADAHAQNIQFEYSILLNSPLHISSIDICAVLANQIDNAIEACAKMPIGMKRSIKVDIWQKETFLFFKVINTANANPFNNKHELISDKSDTSSHGFGIKNIQETVSRYNGTLRNDFKEGLFTSVAMMVNNE